MTHTFRTKGALLGSTVALAAVLVAGGIGAAATMQASADEANVSGGPAITEVYGQLVQRTPDGAYNTDVLKGDMRGCYACHGNLNELMLQMYPEHNPSYGLEGVEPTIEQCLGCHKNASYAGDLGLMLHAIHGVNMGGSTSAECFSCHSTTADGQMVLWDAVKHDQFHGISKVADVAGTFTWDQDFTVSASEMPNAQWMSNYYDELRFNNERDGVPLDQEMFDTWEFSITGMVEQEKTWSLPELIEQAPSETAVLSAQCTINPLGGEAVAQVEVTGIPLSWLLEQVSIDPEATSFSWYSPDGLKASYRGQDFNELEGHEAYLVYEINGQPLSWTNGYPCMLWIGGYAADHLAKNVSEIRIGNDDYTLGSPGVPAGGDGTLKGTGKPNLGFLNTLEGKIISADEPYTFEGWADGFELNIAAIEFSMDGGQTWTTCETPDANVNRWVHWSFEFTPEPGVDTAYVLQIRAVADDGRTTPTPVSVMVNAKAGFETPETE